MKRTWTIILAALLALGVLAPAASADEGGEPPPHGHMLVQRLDVQEELVEIDGEPWLEVTLTFRRCVDVAAGRYLPLQAHHDSIHTGSAGAALRDNAGHYVIPTVISPWENCADLIANPVILEPLGEEE
jgi:hypothetical protein